MAESDGDRSTIRLGRATAVPRSLLDEIAAARAALASLDGPVPGERSPAPGGAAIGRRQGSKSAVYAWLVGLSIAAAVAAFLAPRPSRGPDDSSIVEARPRSATASARRPPPPIEHPPTPVLHAASPVPTVPTPSPAPAAPVAVTRDDESAKIELALAIAAEAGRARDDVDRLREMRSAEERELRLVRARRMVASAIDSAAGGVRDWAAAARREIPAAVVAPPRRTATISVLMPAENAELIVRGEVGRGNPDEWYGPTRVIHTPPLDVDSEYLIGAFWKGVGSRPRTQSVKLRVRPGDSWEVDLRPEPPATRPIDPS